MAKDTQLTDVVANAQADATCTLANSGKIRIYSGTKPATGDTALSGNTLLAELTFGSTAFGSAAAGVATANSITSDTSADNTGTATFFRIFKTDGTTALWDGTVGTATANCILNSTAIQAGAQVDITAFTFTAHKSTSGY